MTSNNVGEQPITMSVRALRWECDGVLSVVLTDPSGADVPQWEPGTHIDVSIPGVGLRQYSLCGDHANRSELCIGVLREEHSRGGSEYVHSQLRPGDTISISSPRNNFVLDKFDEYVFLAGGIGITPILPMVAEVDRRGVRWHLTYGGRRATSMAFVDEVNAYGDNVTLWPEDENGLLDLDTILDSQAAAAVYCCGPASLLDAVERRNAHVALRGPLNLPGKPWDFLPVQFHKIGAIREHAAGRPWVCIDDLGDEPDPVDGLIFRVDRRRGIHDVDPQDLYARLTRSA